MHTNSRILVSILVGVVVVAIENAVCGQPPASPVIVAPVVVRDVNTRRSFVGTVTPVQTAVIGSAVDGRVIEFLVNEGDFVKSGQPLAQLMTTTIGLELAAAEGELELRKQELSELENGTRPDEIEQARARMAAAEASSKFIAQRRDRIVTLFQTGRASSVDERDQAIAEAFEAEQRYLELQAAYQLAVEGPRTEQIAQAKARVAIQTAQVEKLRDQITKHTIVSRFDGYVTAEHTEVGQWVQQGAPIAEVTALDRVDVLVQVVEEYIPFVQSGAIAEVVVPALPDRSFQGKVVVIVPSADRRARTFPVKVRIPNETTEAGPVLKAGMYAQVSLPVGSVAGASLVPKDALVLGGPTTVVFVVDRASNQENTGKARPVSVQVGSADGSLVQVSGPLKEGELVIVEGNERLRPGQAVQWKRVAQDEARQEPVAATETSHSK